jgi:hypothetical protein
MNHPPLAVDPYIVLWAFDSKIRTVVVRKIATSIPVPGMTTISWALVEVVYDAARQRVISH